MKNGSKFFSLRNWKEKLLEVEMGKTVGGESFRGKTELNFGHINFETSTRHANGDVE